MTEKKNNKLFANSFLYTFSGLLSKCIHFFLLPLYTAFLSTEDYGIQNMILSFNAVMNYILLLCLDSAALKFYADNREDKEKCRRFFGTALLIVAFTSFVSLIIIYLIKDILIEYLFEGVNFFPHLVIGLAILVLEAFFTLYRRILEAEQNGKKVTLISIVVLIVTTLTTILLVCVLKCGVVGLLLATLIATGLSVLYMLFDITKHKMIKLCFDISLAKESLKYSLPIIPHQISGYLAMFISRVFLQNASSVAVVGLFSVASQFVSVIDVFQDSVSRAYRPWLFEKINEHNPENSHIIRNISEILMLAYTIIYGGIAIFSFEMITLMTPPSYHEVWKVMPIMTFGYSIKSIYYFYVSQCLYYKKSSKKVFAASISGSLANVFGSALLIPLLGIYGIAISYCLSHLVCTILVIIANRHNEKIGYNLPVFTKVLFVAWIFIVIAVIPQYLFFSNAFSIYCFLFKTFVCVCYVLYIWIFYRKKICSFLGDGWLKKLLRGF